MSHPLVRATCPACGDVVLTTDDLRLDEHDCQSFLAFECPRCRIAVSHGIPAGIVHLLQAAGVRPMDRQDDLLSDDELATFLADFDRVDCFDQLRRLGHGV